MMDDKRDSEIVAQCLRGEGEAFEEFVDKYQKPLFNAVYRITHNYNDAEDICQAAFIKAYENLKTFNPKYKFFSWIYRIAVNESLNYLKQKKRVEELNGKIISNDKNPEDILHESEISEQVQNALMELKPEYRILIILRHFQSCTYDEIAYILDGSVKEVKSRLYMARQQLRKIFIKNNVVPNG
jgi:RNA polymerase sigma-70 factor (ECF subfamily)